MPLPYMDNKLNDCEVQLHTLPLYSVNAITMANGLQGSTFQSTAIELKSISVFTHCKNKHTACL